MVSESFASARLAAVIVTRVYQSAGVFVGAKDQVQSLNLLKIIINIKKKKRTQNSKQYITLCKDQLQ